METSREISCSTHVAASAQAAYALVSDLPRMGELSPENRGGRWLGGATGPVVGARFRGHNRNGWRSWSTTVTVEQAEPGRVFAFRVAYAGIPVARWGYRFDPQDGGCLVTETWEDRRPGWFRTPAGVFTGVHDRAEAARSGMDLTLANLKAQLERVDV